MKIRFANLTLSCIFTLSAIVPPALAASPDAMNFLDELKGLYLDNPSPPPRAPSEGNSMPEPGRINNPSPAPATNRSTRSTPGIRHPAVDQSMLATTFAIPYGRSRLVVETRNVRFATVLIDGIIMGMTPIAVDLPDGRGQVVVEIRKKGYHPKKESVRLYPGHTEKWIARLRPLPDPGP